MVVVIGSGPAGAAAAHALCNAGLRVTVLDAGDRIERGRMDLFDALAGLEPDRWPPTLAARARGAFPADVKQIPLKPAYGSLFPYAVDDPDLPIVNDNADTLSSLAYGGLSNTWGAAILPFRQTDIEEWPITLADLEPHYEAVQRFVPVAAEPDELCETLPLYTNAAGKLRRGKQAELLIEHLRAHAAALERAGFTFGASRLAVRTFPQDQHRCRHSGMCLYGCPYRSIYNAAQTIDALQRTGLLDYRAGVHVDRLTETDGVVNVEFHERKRPAARNRLTASRVFVACGAVATTRLMLRSAHRGPCARRMCDSQYFMIPAVAHRAAPVSVAEQGNTLAQVFLELHGADLSTHALHLQIYGYNDIMLSALTKRIPLDGSTLERLLRPLLGRLVLIQGFLHSTDSPGLTVHCDANRVRVVGDAGAAAAKRVKRIVRRLASHRRLLGLTPVPGLVHVGRPGKSNHIGGSFSMTREPRELETDTLGRLRGWQRVHLVDASIFPSLPATTVTLSVMANAHRIATAVAAIRN